MTTIGDIRKYMPIWANTSYTDGIVFCKGYTNKEKEQATRVLKVQNLTNKVMDGHSIEKLPCMPERETNQIVFSQVFYNTINNGYITPASYLMEAIRESNKHSYREELIPGIVGRGLRALPSFIRELDLPDKLAKQLNAQCYRSKLENDLTEHTDIFLNYKDEQYRIWSYLNTNWGVSNMVDKLTSRGALPRGIHVLCPFNLRDASCYEDICGWRLYNSDYIKRIETLIVKEPADNYWSVIANPQIKFYVAEPHIFKVE